jgi:hypothetical protein
MPISERVQGVAYDRNWVHDAQTKDAVDTLTP